MLSGGNEFRAFFVLQIKKGFESFVDFITVSKYKVEKRF